MRVALVTGASRGIGAGIASALAEQGFRVVWAARDPSGVEAEARRHEGLAVRMDVTDPASIAAALAVVAQSVGHVDVLVNNAGVAESAPLARTTDDSWARLLAVNLTAPFRLSRALVPAMVE